MGPPTPPPDRPDQGAAPPLRRYDSRPLAGPPIVPLLLAVGPADRQVRGTRRPGPILESASLFLPQAALRRFPLVWTSPPERQRKEEPVEHW